MHPRRRAGSGGGASRGGKARTRERYATHDKDARRGEKRNTLPPSVVRAARAAKAFAEGNRVERPKHHATDDGGDEGVGTKSLGGNVTMDVNEREQAKW